MNLITRMIKTTSLVVFVGVIEVVKIGQQIIEANRLTVPTASIAVYFVIFMMYFFVCWLLNLGAKKLDRVIAGIKDALLMMVIYWFFTMAILLPYARDLSMLFIYRSATQILDYSEQFMHVSCLNYLFLGSLVIFRYSLQGLGYTRLAMWSGVSELIARALVSLLVVPSLGFLGVCLGDPAAWVAANIFLLPAFWYVFHKLKKQSLQTPRYTVKW